MDHPIKPAVRPSEISGPVIAAVRTFKELDAAFESKPETIFLLGGELISLRDIVSAANRRNKSVYIHLDLIKGLSKDEAALHYISREVKPAGIISTHRSVIQAAKKYKLNTIQRYFLIDSASLETIYETCQSVRPHFIELMPGIAYKYMKKLSEMIDIPIVAGGLIDNPEDVSQALQAGCIGVSTSKRDLWNLRAGEL